MGQWSHPGHFELVPSHTEDTSKQPQETAVWRKDAAFFPLIEHSLYGIHSRFVLIRPAKSSFFNVYSFYWTSTFVTPQDDEAVVKGVQHDFHIDAEGEERTESDNANQLLTY